MNITDWVAEAYRINFEQLMLYSASEKTFIEFKKEVNLKIFQDEIKFNEDDKEPYMSLRLIVNEEDLYSEFYITFAANLSKTNEIDLLKVIAKMNHKPGAFSYYFDDDENKIKLYSHLNYFGCDDEPNTGNFEIMAYSNILYSSLIDANYWNKKVGLLENTDFVAEDVFKLIDKERKFVVNK